jgi:transposase
LGYIRAKRNNIVNENTLIVAIDIGKESHYGYCVTPNGQGTKTFKFSQSNSGFHRLWENIIKAKEQFTMEKIVVGFESTAAYAEPLVHFLLKKPVELVQINPMHTKKIKELTDNSPNKTDTKDPQVIADIIRLGHFLSVIVPQGPAACLRRLSQARERQVCHRVAFVNQLRFLFSEVFPEFFQIIKKTHSKTARYLIRDYPLPEKLALADQDQLSKEVWKISHGRLNREWVERLIEAAQHSIGIKEGAEAIIWEIRQILNQIESIDQFIRDIEQKMEKELKKVSTSSFLLSIKGLGIVSVAGIIGEVADFGKFRCQSEIIKLAGLNLFEISSGRLKGKRHISKRGRSYLRKLLYFTSLGMVKRDGIMHDYYQKLTKRGMAKPKALIAVSRKLLRIMFAMARDCSYYQRDYHRRPSVVLQKAA